MPVYSLPDVSTGVWSMSVLQPGVILTGLDVYLQRCYVVLNTPLGSDPLRPLFGCGYHQYIDNNSISAAAKMKKEIIDAITIWVPEVTLGKITYTIAPGGIMFNISMTFDGSSVSLPFLAGKRNFFGEVTGTKIINTLFPFGATNVSITLSVDGTPAMPAVPFILPWDDLPGMIAWVRSNWGWAGTWGMSKDEVILYLNGSYKQAVITVAAA